MDMRGKTALMLATDTEVADILRTAADSNGQIQEQGDDNTGVLQK